MPFHGRMTSEQTFTGRNALRSVACARSMQFCSDHFACCCRLALVPKGLLPVSQPDAHVYLHEEAVRRQVSKAAQVSRFLFSRPTSSRVLKRDKKQCGFVTIPKRRRVRLSVRPSRRGPPAALHCPLLACPLLHCNPPSAHSQHLSLHYVASVSGCKHSCLLKPMK